MLSLGINIWLTAIFGGAGRGGPFLLLVDGTSKLLLQNGTDRLLIVTPAAGQSEPIPIIF